MEPTQPPPQLQHQVGVDTKAVLLYQVNSKSVGVTYALWFFLGAFGAHRFYAGRIGSAIAMLLITICSIPLCFILIGFVGVAAVWIWWLVDAFLIPGWIRDFNSRLANTIAA